MGPLFRTVRDALVRGKWFVPAPDLPVRGALAQILIVFGIAETCIGWWRTPPVDTL
ncbi:hypothetical protein ACFWUZ_27275 [Streptomyces sp. NPDC058646]|uniref:hypothetical protein n=1 Tax=Streptomyces sp. NPDC058646 TaxID=3346574 RepID=UPI00366492AE